MEGHIIEVQAADLAHIKETDPRHGYMDSVLCSLRGRGHGKGAGWAADLLAYLSTIAKASLKYK